MANYFTDGANGNDTTGNGSLATPWKTIGKFVSNGYAAGDTLNIQAASTYAEAVTFTTAGTAAAPITIRGYSAAAGDLVGTTTYPTITPTSVSGTAAFVLSGAYNNLQNINIQHSVSGKGALSIGAGHIDLSWCRFSGASSASKMNAVCVNYNYQNYICMSNCLIENVDNSNKGIDGFYSNEFLVNTTIRNCGYGVLNAGPANSIIGCNIYGCNSYGMNIQSGAQLIVNCNISDNGGSGISNNSGAYPITILFSTLCYNTGYGITTSTTNMTANIFNSNLFGNTSSAYDAHTLVVGAGNNTASSPFVGADIATRKANNYLLIAAARQLGFAHLDGTTTYPDLGPNQYQSQFANVWGG